jgi:hypothetical protein
MQRTPVEKATLVAGTPALKKSGRPLFHRRRMIFLAGRVGLQVRALAKREFAA